MGWWSAGEIWRACLINVSLWNEARFTFRNQEFIKLNSKICSLTLLTRVFTVTSPVRKSSIFSSIFWVIPSPSRTSICFVVVFVTAELFLPENKKVIPKLYPEWYEDENIFTLQRVLTRRFLKVNYFCWSLSWACWILKSLRLVTRELRQRVSKKYEIW